MRVHVRFFGSLAAKRGDAVEVSLEDGSTLSQLLERVGLERSDLSLVVLNGSQAIADVPLNDGDQVMLIPPVIGG